MKAYFARLFNYDQFVNHIIADLILKNGNPSRPVQLMAHLLAVQQVWYARCTGEAAPAAGLWPDWRPETFKDCIDANHRNWTAYLETILPEDFDQPIAYKNTRGDDFSSQLTDILTQVTNHGAHHRAQIGQHLAQAGVALPYTDYMAYVWQLGKT